MSLRRKLLLAFVIPVLSLGLVGFAGISSLFRLSQSAKNILSDNYQSIQDARGMERALRAIEQERKERPGNSSLAAHTKAFEDALEECERNITEKGEKDILADVRALWEEISPSHTVALTNNAKIVIGTVKLNKAPLLFERIDDLIDMNERAMFADERETLRRARWAVALMGASLIVVLLVLAVFARVAAQRISRPILEVADNLHDTLKSAALTQERSTHSGDEIKRLKIELDDLLRRLALHTDEETGKLMRLQERLTLVVEEVQEGLILTDERLDVLVLNRTGRELLGLSAEHSFGENLSEMPLRKEARDALAPLFEKSLTEKRDLAEFKIEVGASERVCRPRILPVTSSAGILDGYLIAFWDVTEERRFEESRRSFIAMLSHQLKTPVTSISMSVNLLWERLRGKTEESDELLDIAKDDCQALFRLVNELVEAARDTTSSLALQFRRIDIVRLLREALRPLAPQAREHQVDLRDGMGNAPVFVLADPVKLPWVVTNIVGNALRYTPANGHVSIALAPENESVRIAIADTGAGIAEDDVRRVFLPFPPQGGTGNSGLHGLGLVIAREIVEAHHGTIDVESALGKGTVFTIHLPLAPGGIP